MAVKHAELMMQYAKDAATNDKPWELWEVRTRKTSGWRILTHNPVWNPHFEYRRKQIKIELPKCVTSADEMRSGQPYYVPVLDYKENFRYAHWGNRPVDFMVLERGLVYLNQEDAIKHADILLGLRNT